MLDPKVPANWTLFWKSAPCANSASTTYIQSHYQKTFGLCEVFDSTLFNYGTTNTGQYVYTGGGDKLVVGRNEVMYANDCRTSADNRYDFCYQADGNLVLYDGSTPVWASNTNGTSPGEVHMQGDGNLVVYDSGMTAVWDSQTSSQPGNFVIVQSNRCALMYSEDTNYIPWGTSSCNMSGGGTTQQPPIDPTNLYSSVSGSTVWLYWTPPPGPVNDYILEAGTYPGGTNVGVFYLNNQPYSTSYGVAPGTYYVRVKARNNGGTGPPTADLAVYVP